MKSIRSIKYKKIETIIMVILLILLAIIIGLKRIEISDFKPINGDFQNYNPIRRLLAGQIPFKDFVVYLGSGHLFLLSFFVLILGNNFTSSLFVTNCVTVLLFEFTVFVISFLVLKSKKKAVYIALIFAIINILRPNFLFANMNNEFISAFDFSINPGNSARLIRLSIISIISALIYLFNYIIDNKKIEFIKNKILLKKIVISIIAGITIPWSNDGGIATYIAISFIYFLVLIKQYKKDIKSIVKYTFLYIAISLFTALMCILIITRGHIIDWYEFTLGVSSYQKWYYGEASEKYNISLIDLNMSINNMIIIIISIYYIYKLLKSKDDFRYALLSLICISSIISAYLYQIISGGISNEMLNLVLAVLIVSYIAKIFDIMCTNKEIKSVIRNVIVILTLATLINTYWGHLYNRKHRSEDAVYIEELGGYLTKYSTSIKDISKKINNEQIFSMYASAFEIVTNQYQPTGVDYIIHCLGDKQREKYLENFRQGNYKYVNILGTHQKYKNWVRNTNWFFYRELYKEYVPLFETEYSTFLEKKSDHKKSNQDLKIEKTKLGDSKYSINIESNDANFDGIVDVKISYKANFKKSFLRTLDINKYIYIEDVTSNEIANDDNTRNNYNIKQSSDGYYIPVTIINGKGEVIISSYPINNTVLEINNAEIIDYYDNIFNYCYVLDNSRNSDNSLYVENSSLNKIILEYAKQIKINDTTRNILNIQENGDSIKIELDGSSKEFCYPYYFEVIK